MAGLKALNINTPPEAEPHIYAEDDAAIYKAIFGGDGVSTIGQACKATVLSNNKVRIADGVLCVDGHMARIPYGEYEDCEIMNGQSGKNRNDIIVAKFETTGTGGIDTMTCEVIQGTAGETAVDPELTQDDIYAGGKVREYPLYRVKIEGLSITAVEQMFEIIPSNKELTNKLGNLGQSAAIGQYGSAWNVGTSYNNVGSKLPAVSNDLYETVSGNDAVIKIKKPGTYLLLASSEFGTNAGVGGVVWNAIVLESGTEIARSCAYIYGGSATTVMSHMLQVESSITIKLCSARSAGSGTIQNKGKDLLQCIKIL